MVKLQVPDNGTIVQDIAGNVTLIQLAWTSFEFWEVLQSESAMEIVSFRALFYKKGQAPWIYFRHFQWGARMKLTVAENCSMVT